MPTTRSGHARKNLLIGISSVKRKKVNYLKQTVRRFLDAMSPQEKMENTILVFNANVPASDFKEVDSIRQEFSQDISSGTLMILEREHPNDPHPEMKDTATLTQRWGDDLKRVKWRSKQVLDVAWLMNWAATHHLSYDYFLMMEDDICPTQNYATKARRWVDEALFHRTDWFMASFYNPWPDVHDGELLPPFKFYGVIGQIFRVHDLPVVVEFLKKNFDQSPLDWLFVDFLKKFNRQLIQHSPSLFQHVGKESSFEGKEQPGRSVDYEGGDGC